MTSFQTDIAPMFAPYRANMMWRFDITDYETVKTNAELIWGQIGMSSMPPGPMPPLTQEQQDLFQAWMKEGYPP